MYDNGLVIYLFKKSTAGHLWDDLKEKSSDGSKERIIDYINYDLARNLTLRDVWRKWWKFLPWLHDIQLMIAAKEDDQTSNTADASRTKK